MTLAAVLGYPVAHSRSPAMMNAAIAELGLDWRYLKLPIPPECFAETVRALPASGYVGVNVTLPHKLAAFELADELGEAVEEIGAANTLTFAGGAIRADNTDAGGLLDALAEPVDGRSALVLGAGGAARGAVWALREAGADVSVWNRTEERGQELARELGVAAGPVTRPAILVNTTSVGLHGEGLGGLPLAAVEPEIVVDLVYGAEPTPILRWGAARGARLVDGLEILVRQGARSLAIWTGREAPVDAMRAAVGVQNDEPA